MIANLALTVIALACAAVLFAVLRARHALRSTVHAAEHLRGMLAPALVEVRDDHERVRRLP